MDKLAVIRVDASFIIGAGHVMRCLTLSDSLKKNGYSVIFISRKLKGNLIHLIKTRGYRVIALSEPNKNSPVTYNNHCPHGNWLEVPYIQECNDTKIALAQILKSHQKSADIIIADHYALDSTWDNSIKTYTKNLLKIDDLADRSHDCDILLDQNYYSDMSIRYNDKIDSRCIKLLGPKYSLLSPCFAETRKHISDYGHRLKKKKIVLFFGGMDTVNQTKVALKGILPIVDNSYTIDVIVGEKNPNLPNINEMLGTYSNSHLHIQINNMNKFFAEAFLFIGAVGATTWERCACKLPGIVCSVAINQVESAIILDKIGSHIYLGEHKKISEEDYARHTKELINNKKLLLSLSETSGSLVDALGVSRVVDKILKV